MIYREIEEQKIRDAITLITKNGDSAAGYEEILKAGEVYRQWGLTPIYLADEDLTRMKIVIAETQDKSKLH